MSSKPLRKSGFTLVELLVVIAIIGVMVGLLLPAVQAAREAARRMSCTNKMKQIGLALHNYHDSFNRFPAGVFNASNPNYAVNTWCSTGTNPNARVPWTVAILPYLEQATLHDQFRMGEMFTSSSNVPGSAINNGLFRLGNPAYDCPSNPMSKSEWNSTSYFGVQGGGPVAMQSCATTGGNRLFYRNGALFFNSNIGFRDLLDGTSNVFLVGESKYCLSPSGRADGIHTGWASGSKTDAFGSTYVLAAARDPINSDNRDGLRFDTLNIQTKLFGSFHPGGCHFLLADGSVQFMSNSIDLVIYQTLAIRDDGLPVSGYQN